MGTRFAHGFDAQPVQRYDTLWLVLLSDTEDLIMGFSLKVSVPAALRPVALRLWVYISAKSLADMV